MAVNRVTMQLRVRGEPRQRVWLRLGQVVEVGSSDAADVYIPDDPFVEPLHVSIAHQPMGCFCECLVESAEMRINERRFSRKRLKDKDVVSVGNCDLVITIEHEAPQLVEPALNPSPNDTHAAGSLPHSQFAPSPSESPIITNSPIDFGPVSSPSFSSPIILDGGQSPIMTPRESLQQTPSSEAVDGGEAVDAMPQSDSASRDETSSQTHSPFPVQPPIGSEPPSTEPTVDPAATADNTDGVQSGGKEYVADKLAANVWRYHRASDLGLDLETVVGRLAELFNIFLVVPPPTAARLSNQGIFSARIAEINVGISLIVNPDVTSVLKLLKDSSTRDEVLLIASNSSLDELSASVQQHSFTFGRPSIFTTQILVANQSLADEILLGKIAILSTEHGAWELFSTIDPDAEYQYLGFDRAPRPLP